MTAHVSTWGLQKTRKPLPQRVRRINRALETLEPQKLGQRVVIYTPSGHAIDRLVAKARRSLPSLADHNVVRRVVSRNPDCLWAVARGADYDAGDPVGEGFVAFLMLNAAGLKALAVGALDASDPDPGFLACQHEKPAAIYVWAVYAPGHLAAAIPMVFEKISTPLYRDVDLVAKGVTPDGERFLETLGFQSAVTLGGVVAPQLHIFKRSSGTGGDRPIYDSYRKPAKPGQLSVTVARSMDDITRMTAIRGAVYVAEQDCPYEEEFDGNDFAATHLLGYVGDEPAGCLRVRFFADFAKLERLAVRHEFRHTRLSFQLVRAAIELCRVKGYRRLYGHSQARLVNFWARFGFRTFEGGSELKFSDFDYVEMVCDTTRHPQAIAIGGDPYLIIRPEGRWHEPGVLERSAVRGVTRPSVAIA